MGRFVPGMTAEPDHCRTTKAPSKVTGWLPSAPEKRRRARPAQASGSTTGRNDWSRAPASWAGNTSERFGCADGLPTGSGPRTEAAQRVTQCPPPAANAARISAHTTTSRQYIHE